MMERYAGVWPGIVVSNTDPDRRGKLKVRVPQIFGDIVAEDKIADKDLPWAQPCFPFVGKSSGFAMVPEVGAGVWVAFFGGDPRQPIWLGGWFGNIDNLADHQAGYTPDPTKYIIQTPGGQKMIFSDTITDEGVKLQDFLGQYVQLSTTRESVEISAKKLDIKAMLAMTVTALSTLALSVTAACTWNLMAGLTITAMGTVQILSTSITLGVAATAQSLCNETFLALFNTHTHNYNPGPGTPTPTATPTVPGVIGVHTTVNVKGS